MFANWISLNDVFFWGEGGCPIIRSTILGVPIMIAFWGLYLGPPYFGGETTINLGIDVGNPRP